MNENKNKKMIEFDTETISFIINSLNELTIKGSDCFKLAGIIQTLQSKGTIK